MSSAVYAKELVRIKESANEDNLVVALLVLLCEMVLTLVVNMERE